MTVFFLWILCNLLFKCPSGQNTCHLRNTHKHKLVRTFWVDWKGKCPHPSPFFHRYAAHLCNPYSRALPFVSGASCFTPVPLHLNKAYTLITAIIGDNAIVCLQMKGLEMREQLNATEERSSEPFNLSYWSLSNMTPIDSELTDKQAQIDALGPKPRGIRACLNQFYVI